MPELAQLVSGRRDDLPRGMQYTVMIGITPDGGFLLNPNG